MAFGDTSDRDTSVMAEINIIPLCDVLLVLLIIFMVTAPALSQQIDVDLPQPNRQHNQPPPEDVDLRIEASGQVFWNGEATDRDDLSQRMRVAVSGDGPQPLLKIDASGDCDYQAVATVLATARNAGLANIGFVRRR